MLIFEDRLCHSKVNQLEAVCVIKHYIFWLDVPVSQSFLVKVVHASAQLSEIAASQVLIKGSSVGYDFEECSTLAELLGKRNSILYFPLVVEPCIHVEWSDEPRAVRMIQLKLGVVLIDSFLLTLFR